MPKPLQTSLLATPKSKYYDAKASDERPIWHCVEVRFKKKLKRLISLDELKGEKSLKEMLVIKRGMRLSIQPVKEKEFLKVCEMAEK